MDAVAGCGGGDAADLLHRRYELRPAPFQQVEQEMDLHELSTSDIVAP